MFFRQSLNRHLLEPQNHIIRLVITSIWVQWGCVETQTKDNYLKQGEGLKKARRMWGRPYGHESLVLIQQFPWHQWAPGQRADKVWKVQKEKARIRGEPASKATHTHYTLKTLSSFALYATSKINFTHRSVSATLLAWRFWLGEPGVKLLRCISEDAIDSQSRGWTGALKFTVPVGEPCTC